MNEFSDIPQKTGHEDEVSIIVNGQILSGWTGVSIRTGIELMPATFELETTEFTPNTTQIAIKGEDPCTVLIGPDKVISGYVVSVDKSLSSSNHSVRVTGASKSVDLTECSAIFDTYQVNNTTPLQLAQKLCKPFNIQVETAGEIGALKIPQFSVVLTETPYEIIERVCRYAGLLAYDLPNGNIVLSRTGKTQASGGFREGSNIETAGYGEGIAGRFSFVQAILVGNDLLFSAPGQGEIKPQVDHVSIGAKVFDAGVPRYRPLLIMAEQGDYQYKITQQRAQWEINRRIARSSAVQIRCDSWRDGSGKLWAINTLASVNIPTLKCTPKNALLISEIVFSKSVDEGTHADITLMDAKAFLPEPINLTPLAAGVAQAVNENAKTSQNSQQMDTDFANNFDDDDDGGFF
ncbi:phage baseplate assembly protein [Entomobacter blattae]|uniref:Phage tail protein n=1 Tax=Entomobacter blattae TaxID=2762277 RepID=A0A7H1NUJ1_9PROT|nr:phage tail protein [Entomobacter blattae]QNT79451.1 hypothetical protein JGUZn3_22500 [Entomobacter blattae]